MHGHFGSSMRDNRDDLLPQVRRYGGTGNPFRGKAFEEASPDDAA
jgi:hypothetical protein